MTTVQVLRGSHPEDKVGRVAEQEQFYREWLASLG